MISNCMDQTVEITEISDPTRQSDSCIGNVRKSRHTPTQHDIRHDSTPQHRQRLAWLLLLLLLLGTSQRDTSFYLRPSAARDSTRWPRFAVSMTFCQTAALVVALATLEEIQLRDGLEDETKESSPRSKLTRCSRKKRDMSMYAWLAQLLEDEDLSYPTSITAKAVSNRLPPAPRTLFS